MDSDSDEFESADETFSDGEPTDVLNKTPGKFSVPTQPAHSSTKKDDTSKHSDKSLQDSAPDIRENKSALPSKQFESIQQKENVSEKKITTSENRSEHAVTEVNNYGFLSESNVLDNRLPDEIQKTEENITEVNNYGFASEIKVSKPEDSKSNFSSEKHLQLLQVDPIINSVVEEKKDEFNENNLKLGLVEKSIEDLKLESKEKTWKNVEVKPSGSVNNCFSDNNMWDDDWNVTEEELFEREVPNPIEDEQKEDTVLKSVKKIDDSEVNLWNDDEDWLNLDLPGENRKNQEKLEGIPSEKYTPPESQTPKPNWGGWGNWGVTSLLQTATQGVSTLKHHVTQGLNTVVDTMNVPDPEVLAKEDLAKDGNKQIDSLFDKHDQRSDKFQPFGLSNLVTGVSNITKFVENTGTKVISSGLDTLEVIGKKTMEVLQEGDPGLKKKRALFKIEPDKPVLSQVLREAKEKAEKENKILEEKHFSRKANYETLFDDHEGLIHLEALEMLSKQCTIKLETLLSTKENDSLLEMQETLNQIKELCELPETDDENNLNSWDEIFEKLESDAAELGVNINYEKFNGVWCQVDVWLKDRNDGDIKEVHLKAIDTLAQLTAIAVEQYHRIGELLLIKELRSTADEADCLFQLTVTLSSAIDHVASKFTEKLNSIGDQESNQDNINSSITNIFLEASNSVSYIRDAFQLLLPVLQIGAV